MGGRRTQHAITQELVATYQRTRSIDDRNRVIEHCLPLLHHLANNLHARLPAFSQQTAEDLVSCGVLGLIAALERYDAGRGVRFAHYAYFRAQGAMLESLRQLDPLGPNSRRLARKRGEALPELFSLDAPLRSFDGRKSRHDLLSNPQQTDPGRRLFQRAEVAELLRGFDRRDRLLLILYYAEELTMKEIGQSLGIHETRVSMLIADIHNRLRKRLGREVAGRPRKLAKPRTRKPRKLATVAVPCTITCRPMVWAAATAATGN